MQSHVRDSGRAKKRCKLEREKICGRSRKGNLESSIHQIKLLMLCYVPVAYRGIFVTTTAAKHWSSTTRIPCDIYKINASLLR